MHRRGSAFVGSSRWVPTKKKTSDRQTDRQTTALFSTSRTQLLHKPARCFRQTTHTVSESNSNGVCAFDRRSDGEFQGYIHVALLWAGSRHFVLLDEGKVLWYCDIQYDDEMHAHFPARVKLVYRCIKVRQIFHRKMQNKTKYNILKNGSLLWIPTDRSS